MAEAKPTNTFVMLLGFIVVAFVIFDPTLRAILGRAVGAVFEPTLGFDGRHPLLTVALAGMVMILASTVIRHFLVDWVKMARVQEVMRHFQKEFREAQKANNTYKMKRLTEAQPEIMQMQADLSGEQLKPMALTMVVVVPIFLWLSTFMATPVAYEATHAGDGEVLLVAYGDALYAAEAVDRTGEIGLAQHSHVHAYTVTPGADGSVTLSSIAGSSSFDVPARPLPEGKPVPASPGKIAVRTVDNLDMWDSEKPAKLNRVLVLVLDPDGTVAATHVVAPGLGEIDVAEGQTLRAFVLAPPNAEPRGANPLQLHVGDERVDFAAEDVVLLPTPDGESTLYPKIIRVPWNTTWDLNTSWWILPHWIILYTLISIPLGTLVQRLLKMWEFKRVDLDADGVPAGRNL